jgi:hypothetical protein
MKNFLTGAALALCTFGFMVVPAASHSAEAPSSASTEPNVKPAEPSTESGMPLAPTDLTALRAALGKSVTIEGTPARAAETKSKNVRFLDFSSQIGTAITVVVLAGKGEPVSLEDLQKYVGKKVRVTGLVSEFSGRLQVPIEKKSQIQVLP